MTIHFKYSTVNPKNMKTFWHIARSLLGLVFIFSGFVKGIDPMGSAYKLTDYFQAWHLSGLHVLSLPLGLMLSSLEFLTGISLLCRVFIRLFSQIALGLMIFFTTLTLFIALTNPVTDCGCFGDALKLTNWHTFLKNSILLPLAWFVVRQYSRIPQQTRGSQKRAVWTGGIAFIVFTGCIYYSYNHLPLIDFRPFKTGVNISKAMTVPANAPKDIYKNTFIYQNRKTGKEKEFTEANYPWKDSLNWKFVSLKTKLIQKGAEASIQNFSIETFSGENISDFFLNDSRLTFMLLSPDLADANWTTIAKIKQLAAYALQHNMNFIGLTASLPKEIVRFKKTQQLSFDFFNTDEITLRTMIRSNPGLMVIKSGTILEKWHYHDIPSPEAISSLQTENKQK